MEWPNQTFKIQTSMLHLPQFISNKYTLITVMGDMKFLTL